MKKTDITQLRQLLKQAEEEIESIIVGDYPESKGRALGLLNQALTLLPFPTCNGTGKKRCFPDKGNTPVLSPKGFDMPCPDCQKNP